MKVSEYQHLASRTSDPEKTTRERLDNVAYGLMGETGEIVDTIKKHIHHGHPVDTVKLSEELGDLSWYLSEACTVVGVSLEDVMRDNIDKLRRRYPDGFSHESSINREK